MKTVTTLAWMLAALVLPVLPQDIQTYTEDDIDELRAKADAGDAEAQYYLAEAYAMGVGVAQDDKEAERWYRLAAEQGYGVAQEQLAALEQRSTGSGLIGWGFLAVLIGLFFLWKRRSKYGGAHGAADL